MDDLALGLRRFGAAKTRRQLVDALWNLRDSAYDSPQLWTALTPETLFQALAEELEQVPDDSGQPLVYVLASALEEVLGPRLPG